MLGKNEGRRRRVAWGCKESDMTLSNEQQQLSTSQNDNFIAGGDEEKHTEKSPSGSS